MKRQISVIERQNNKTKEWIPVRSTISEVRSKHMLPVFKSRHSRSKVRLVIYEPKKGKPQ